MVVHRAPARTLCLQARDGQERWRSMSTLTASVAYPSLAGRTVFVSGGASGIGAALVTRFAGQGCRVAFCDIDDAAAQALVATLAPATVRYHRCDLRDIVALRAT